MAKVQKTQNKIDKAIDSGVGKLLKDVDKTQKNIYSSLLTMVKDLKLNSDGSIKQTTENLKLSNKIRRTVEEIAINPKYKRQVGDFLNSYNDVEEINSKYLKTIEKAFKPTALLYKQLKQSASEQMSNSLLEAGINENVINPVRDIVNKSVTEGAFYSDMVAELQKFILDDDENLGHLHRYASQISWDGMQQYNRSYNMTFAKNFKKEWFRYSSGLVRDSRRYCKRRQGRYFHAKEIEDSASERWAGKIPATNSSSIFRYCGGYNCKHHYTPVLIDIVPQSVIDRNIRNGNYKPDK